ncbi:winged helix-turn-helix domain-containing protein [Paenibacillus assamensis]|uniref:winged helix-turn-helix domain-containing protein n=1 Tax=Paenibacillus assamensis TaxID=311244 RepID=UPI00040D34CC|nr:helix-turn-helix domain-containing protein [Paenibacillus assamensis]
MFAISFDTRLIATLKNDRSIDIARGLITTNEQGQIEMLTPIEHRLLQRLLMSPNQVVSTTILIQYAWVTDTDHAESNKLHVYIKKLRSKLGEDSSNPEYIINVRGAGYMFILDTIN